MEKKYQKLYIWSFIIISGIILAMLYTPLGGNLNNSVYGDYNTYPSSGVDFKGGIGNAPKNGRATQARNYNDAVPVNSGTANSMLSKPVVAIGGGSTSHSNLQGGGSYQSSGLRSGNNAISGGAGGGGGTGMIALGGRSSGGSTGGSGGGGFSGGGIFSAATPSSETEAVIQKGTQGMDDMADPSSDPIGSTIPVGDGFYILLLLGVMYGYYISRKSKKTSNN